MDGVYLSIPSEEYVELLEIKERYKKERKRGRWIIEDKYKDYRTERCSICGFVANRSYIQDIWHFCPNCGARMEASDD